VAGAHISQAGRPNALAKTFIVTIYNHPHQLNLLTRTALWLITGIRCRGTAEMVKRIIQGKTYNTETAISVLERCWAGGSEYRGLYQTKHGAFFLWWYDDYSGGIKPMSDSEAQDWLEKYEAPAEIFERLFGEMQEGGAAEIRLTIRLPGNLHSRLTSSAESAGASLNTYIMRVLERSERPTVS